MEKNKENKESGESKKALTPQQLQRRKKMLIFPLLFLLFAGSMWLIFAPSSDEKEKEQAQAGFNADLPMPKEEGMVADKKSAYEAEQLKQKEDEKRRSLQDFAFALGEEEKKQRDGYQQPLGDIPNSPEYYEKPALSAGGGSRSQQRTSAIQSSTAAYQDINKQLGSFYEQPAAKADEQVPSAVESRIQELERKLDEEAQRKRAEEDQLAMVEKSYQLAAKYMPGAAQETNTNAAEPGEKLPAQPVRQVRQNVVSLLATPMSNDEFVAQFSQPRNMSFLTAAGNEGITDKNSIGASVYQTVTLTNGKEVQLRLLEPLMAGNFRIPAGTILTGACRIVGDRLDVTIHSIQYAGNIIGVELSVYDTDGQRGVFVPNSDEITAAKEIAANLGSSAGSSFMISDNAGSQLAADLGKGLIQGASQYVSKKMQTVKVTLKAGYRVLLLPKNQ